MLNTYYLSSLYKYLKLTFLLKKKLYVDFFQPNYILPVLKVFDKIIMVGAGKRSKLSEWIRENPPKITPPLPPVHIYYYMHIV